MCPLAGMGNGLCQEMVIMVGQVPWQSGQCPVVRRCLNGMGMKEA